MVKKKCCNGMLIPHLVLIAGIYVLTWGLIGVAAVGAVLKSPIFCGLILIFGALCGFAAKRMKA